MRDRPLHSIQNPTGPAILLDCFRAALDAVDGRVCVRTQLARERISGQWHVVAIGKAAGSMAAGAHDYLGRRMGESLVITKAGNCPALLASLPQLTVIESAHPRPDQRSLDAGRSLVAFVKARSPDARLLILVSGGTSSLVEDPCAGIELADLQYVNDWALASGRSIEEVNLVRRELSRLKGGGLATLIGPREALALMISDVPNDDPRIIGSGLLHAPASRTTSHLELPARIVALLDRARRCPEPRKTVRSPPCRIVASIRDARRAAGACGKARGLKVRYGRGRFSGNAVVLGARFARSIITSAPETLWVWGGESTVELPPNPGRGGRNQHLALSSATKMAGIGAVWLLAAGTDGVDGCSEDAGALIDGSTIERGVAVGAHALTSLARADSGRFLEATGDLLYTGPTATNVGDIVLGLKLGPAP